MKLETATISSIVSRAVHIGKTEVFIIIRVAIDFD